MAKLVKPTLYRRDAQDEQYDNDQPKSEGLLNVTSQHGQVSFPGPGKMDDEDSTGEIYQPVRVFRVEGYALQVIPDSQSHQVLPHICGECNRW